MMPPGLVCAWAAAKVLHGAVRVQALASLPCADTKVRNVVAWAGAAARPSASEVAVSSPGVILVMGCYIRVGSSRASSAHRVIKAIAIAWRGESELLRRPCC